MSQQIRRTARARADGMTLVETTIALVVLSVGILAMFAAQISALQQTSQGRHATEAAQVARDQMEFLQRLPWSHPAVQPGGAFTNQRTVTTLVNRLTGGGGTAQANAEQTFDLDHRVTVSALDPKIRAIEVRVRWSDADSQGGANRVYVMSGFKVEEMSP